MTRAECSKSGSIRTSPSAPFSTCPTRSVSRISLPMSWATVCTVPSSAVTVIPSHSRLVSTTTSVKKFWDRRARPSSLPRTKSNAPAVRRLDPSSRKALLVMVRGLVEAVLLDLVQERLVADAQVPGGLLAIPAGLLQHLENQLALDHAGGGAGDVLERAGRGLARFHGGDRTASGGCGPTRSMRRQGDEVGEV